MDDKQLDELLRETKKDYEKLPEYTKTKTIMSSLLKQKKPKRNKWIPSVAVFAGLILFSILVIPTLENHQQASIGKDDLVAYYEIKKEEFQQELGIDSVDYFLETEQANSILEEAEDTMTHEELEQKKEAIATIFKTPNQLIEEINNGEDAQLSEDKLDSILRKLSFINASFDHYFSELKIDHLLVETKQQELYENQYDYTGDIEIVEFLNAIHEQGFYIGKVNFAHQRPLQIRVDYERIVNQISNWQGFEGLREYLIFSHEKFDVFYPGIHNMQEIPWYAFDDLLLEFEVLLENYPENKDLILEKGGAKYTVSAYLKDYLSGGVSSREFPPEDHRERLQEELYHFVESHEDSLFAPIVSNTIEMYEKNNWNYDLGKITNEINTMLDDGLFEHD